MKAKKWLVIITGILSVGSFVCAYLYCECLTSEFFRNFAFAILGSALLGMIMSLTEYLVVRKEALISYYSIACGIIRKLATAHYVFMREPLTMLQDYFSEETDNLYREATEHKAKNALLAHMNETWKQTKDIPEPEYTKWSNNEFNARITRYKKDIEKAMQSYIEIAEVDLEPLESAYGELDFFFANWKLRKWIYNSIHCPIRDYRNNAARKAYHFRMYLSGESDNLSDLVNMIDELQNLYFSVEKKSDGYYSVVTVMRKSVDALEDLVEELRCRIYRKKYTASEHFPYLEFHILEKIAFPFINERKHTTKNKD